MMRLENKIGIVTAAALRDGLVLHRFHCPLTAHSAASFCGRTAFSRIVTNSSAALGWRPTV